LIKFINYKEEYFQNLIGFSLKAFLFNLKMFTIFPDERIEINKYFEKYLELKNLLFDTSNGFIQAMLSEDDFEVEFKGYIDYINEEEEKFNSECPYIFTLRGEISKKINDYIEKKG